MLVSCSSCNSKYLVNSADLKPNGRIVQCAKCGHNWFQIANIEDEEILSTSVPLAEKKIDNNNNLTTNLPTRYVKEEKSSILNSTLVVILLAIFIISFWFLKNNGINFFVLIIFYLQEFYFNLNMIINDLTKIIHEILN